MDSKPDSAFAAAPCLAISAALFFLGTGLAPLWPLAWLAAVPVLWVAPRLSARQAFFVAAAAYAIGFLNEWTYLRTVLATWIVSSSLVVSACLFAVGVLLFRLGVVRGKLWAAVLVFPAYWTSVEFAIARHSVHGTFGDISYSQLNFLPILQIASVTGIWGISFTVFLFASTVAGLLLPAPRPAKLRVLIGCAVFILGVLAYGAWRLWVTPTSPTIKVALIASDAPENMHPETATENQQVFQRYADRVKLREGQGIQLFVLPETIGAMTDTSEAEIRRLLREAGERIRGVCCDWLRSYLAVGLFESGAAVLAARRTGGKLQQAPSSASWRKSLHPWHEARGDQGNIRNVGFGNLQGYGLSELEPSILPRWRRFADRAGVGLRGRWLAARADGHTARRGKRI